MAVLVLPNNRSCHWEAISINKQANKNLRQNSAGDGTGSFYTREMTSNCLCLLIFVPLTYSAFGYLNWPFNFLNICFESVIVNQQWWESLIGFQSKISGFQVNYLFPSIFLCYWIWTKTCYQNNIPTVKRNASYMYIIWYGLYCETTSNELYPLWEQSKLKTKRNNLHQHFKNMKCFP